MKRYRAALRVCSEPTPDSFRVTIAGWNWRAHPVIPLSALPEPMRPHIKKGTYLHAMMNLGADKAKDLAIDSWELG